jgi:hypothetical protein
MPQILLDRAAALPSKRGRQEEQQDGSEEEQQRERRGQRGAAREARQRNEEQRQQCLALMEECKEIEQFVVAELVAILGRQEAEKALMAEAQRVGWGGFT